MYEGEPILAVAAVDELTAAEAIEKIVIEFEPLPFAVDPIASLRPGSTNARSTGNVWVRPTPPPAAAGAAGGGRGAPGAAAASRSPGIEMDRGGFRSAPAGQMPLGKHTDEWSYGDLEAGFKDAALVIDRTWVGQNTSHQVLEPRSAMAYWQNGKLYPARRHAEHGADRAVDRAMGRHRSEEHRPHQRVHGRRLRQPHSRATSRWRFRRCSRRRSTRR